MRPLIALFLLAFSLFPEIASAKKKPPKIIPALANAKTIGIHCNSGYAPVPALACREFLDSLRGSLGSGFKVSEDLAPLRLQEESGGAPDIYIDFTADTERHHDFFTGGLVTASLYQANVLDGKTHRSISSGPISDFNESVGGTVKVVYMFIFLHSGLAAKECAEPRTALGNVAQDDASWRRFEKLCREYGLK